MKTERSTSEHKTWEYIALVINTLLFAASLAIATLGTAVEIVEVTEFNQGVANGTRDRFENAITPGRTDGEVGK